MENVIISDKLAFEQKKTKLIDGGAKNLHILADFDMTFTKAYREGKKVNTIIGLLRHGSYLTSDYPKKAFALHDKYRPIETDPFMPIEEKSKYMEEWWNTHLNLITASGMKKELVKEIVKKKEIVFREGALEFLKETHKKNIPILFLSAALGDIIEEMLKAENAIYPTTHILSNFFNYDKNGGVIGYKSKIIHSLNKNEAQIKNTPHYAEIKNRRNIILLGDNIDDLLMAQGVEHDTLITIGFLNENIEENLKHYKKAFDVVITGDGGMEFANKLIKEIK